MSGFLEFHTEVFLLKSTCGNDYSSNPWFPFFLLLEW